MTIEEIVELWLWRLKKDALLPYDPVDLTKAFINFLADRGIELRRVKALPAYESIKR